MSIDIVWRGNSNTNYSSRRGNTPQIIVNHITASTKKSADSWFRSSHNENSSCHFLVNRDGSIYQYVKIKDNAWCNGLREKNKSWATSPFLIDYWNKNGWINPNWISVSIEHEALAKDIELTEEQYQSTLKLHIKIIKVIKELYNYNMPIDREHIIGHKEIDKVNKPFCPMENFPFERLIEDIKAYFKSNQKQIPQWATDLGINAIDELHKKGLISSPDVWKNKDLGEQTPLWLFFHMINKIADN